MKQMQGIENMYQVAMARKKEPMEGSYTNYLFDKGLEKILKSSARKIPR
jgi:phosphoribosyl-ATP pyrophosphohydrolase